MSNGYSLQDLVKLVLALNASPEYKALIENKDPSKQFDLMKKLGVAVPKLPGYTTEMGNILNQYMQAQISNMASPPPALNQVSITPNQQQPLNQSFNLTKPSLIPQTPSPVSNMAKPPPSSTPEHIAWYNNLALPNNFGGVNQPNYFGNRKSGWDYMPWRKP